MDKKETVSALWKMESRAHAFIEMVAALKNESFCKCPADRNRIDAWIGELRGSVAVIQTAWNLIETYKEDLELNKALYKNALAQFEKTANKVIDGVKLNG